MALRLAIANTGALSIDLESIPVLSTIRCSISRADWNDESKQINSPNYPSFAAFVWNITEHEFYCLLLWLPFIQNLLNLPTIVTLNHQRFCQPLPRASVRRSSTGSETQTTDIVRQSDATEERNEADYTLENNMPQEERSTLSLGKIYSKHFPPMPLRINTVSPILEPGEPPQANSPKLYLNDIALAAGNYPDYPKEVALYPSSRDTTSVTGLEGPGTTRVFDVFKDNSTR